MSDLRTLADKLKAALSVSDVTGKRLLAVDANGSLCKSALGGFLTGLNADKLATKQLIDEDLNTLKGADYSGKYFVGHNGNTCANKPDGVSFFGLQIYDSGDGKTTQVLTSSDNVGSIYIRIWNYSSWSAWRQLATTDRVFKLVPKALSNQNLDTIKSGALEFYFAYGGNSCANTPFNAGSGFSLQVFGQDSSYCCQIITSLSGVQYKRFNQNNTWLPWKRMLTEDDLTPLINRIAALESAG